METDPNSRDAERASEIARHLADQRVQSVAIEFRHRHSSRLVAAHNSKSIGQTNVFRIALSCLRGRRNASALHSSLVTKTYSANGQSSPIDHTMRGTCINVGCRQKQSFGDRVANDRTVPGDADRVHLPLPPETTSSAVPVRTSGSDSNARPRIMKRTGGNRHRTASRQSLPCRRCIIRSVSARRDGWRPR